MRADIICVFCTNGDEIEPLIKRHAIQCDKSGSWNLSNFRKHILKHSINSNQDKNDSFSVDDSHSNTPLPQSTPQPEKKKADLSEKNVSFVANETNILSLPIIIEDEEDAQAQAQADYGPGTNELLFSQFSAQNLRLLEASLANNEPPNLMATVINDRFAYVTIVKIDDDGNCMFSALVHQIDNVKNGSDTHKTRTVELRKAVVNHIDKNFERYKQSIKSRFSIHNDMDEDGKEFISNDLSKEGSWGGAETLLAVSHIFSVNILIFNERGEFYFATGFNANYNRTIFLAYRVGSMSKNGSVRYNHYDSIIGLSEEILYNCASVLSKKMQL